MKIIGSMYRDMIVSAACCLDNDKERINNLNVFPVPDGDTGINMSLTMSGVRGDYTTLNATVGESAQKAANLMLRGARGNSGVILSLFFRGIAKAWKELDEADTSDIVRGFERGVAEAYKAVMNPTEGTILTVMRVMTEKARESVEDGMTDILSLFELMKNAAADTLEMTPELLPQLKQAGVVDSGGAGFLDVMNGMLECLRGNPVKAENSGSVSEAKTSEKADFSSFDTENIKYAYCTECIVTKNEKFVGEGTSDALHQYIMNIGDSVVFVDDAEIIKLHVHTNKPGKVLTEALRYGSLYTVKIENMKNQHSSLSAMNEATTDSTVSTNEKADAETVNASAPAEPEKDYGFVTVCMGDGLTALFHDLAADQIVSGGQTMNPSTDDIVNAVLATPAKTVFVLPNNKNIYMVSQQAADIVEDRKVVVLETVSVPEGVAAMLAFDVSADLNANLEAMKTAVGNVTTLSTTYAVRDTEIGETAIKEGETLGLFNGKIICTSDSRIACIKGLISKVDRAEFVTVYSGEGAEEVDEVTSAIQEKFPDAEVVAMDGGQPVYSYIISIE